MKLTKEMLENEMWHDHAGNGWAVIELLSEEWARVVQIGKDGIGEQAFLVWTRKLKPAKPISAIFPGCLETLSAVRKSIEIGEMEVVHTRFRKVNPQPTQ